MRVLDFEGPAGAEDGANGGRQGVGGAVKAAAGPWVGAGDGK